MQPNTSPVKIVTKEIDEDSNETTTINETAIDAWKSEKYKELVFYDIETTIPCTDMIEFGAIVVSKIGLFEIERYGTLIKSSNITKRSIECNGITENMVENAPTFESIADNIFRIMNNRIWVKNRISSLQKERINKFFLKGGA